MYGIEVEGSVLLPANFQLDGALGLEKGRILSDELLLDGYQANLAQLASEALGFAAFSPETIAARAAAAQSVRGNEVPKLPFATGNLTLSHQLDLDAGAQVRSSINMVYRGSFEARVFNADGIDGVPDYLLLNARVRYLPAEGPWEFELAVSNLTNEDGVSSRFVDAFGIATDANGRGVITEEYVPPRQVMATVRINF
jgi:outer membrane receptor protein involved in Fe transport